MNDAPLTNDIVLETLALPGWVASKDGNRTILRHPANTNGYIAIDWVLMAVAYCANSWPEASVTTLLQKWSETAVDTFNCLRLLGAESSAISDMKNPGRHFTLLSKLFRAMDARIEDGQGTSAVYGYVWHELNGRDTWSWVLIEGEQDNATLIAFEAAVAALKKARELGNKVSAKRAQNMIDFLTRASLSDQWLKVGSLTQAGWQWDADASLLSEDALLDLGYDDELGMIRCWAGNCNFEQSTMWRLGYTGHFVSEMHLAYLRHKEIHPNCEGDIR
jgi:hypothetical protein